MNSSYDDAVLSEERALEECDRASKVQCARLPTKTVVLAARRLETPKEVRTVLSEEKYLSTLEKIVVRDYFPELPKLTAQSEYMDAVERNDLAKIRELQVRYGSSRRTQRRTSPTARRRSPELFDPETPVPGASATPRDSNKEGDNLVETKAKEASDGKKTKKKDSDLSIDAYLAKFTSEDNASFEELTALHEKRERIRNAWMYEAEKRHNAEKICQQALPAAADEQLMLPSTEKPKELDNWTYRARSTVLFHPEDAPLTVEEHIERQKMNQRIINKDSTRFNDDPFKHPINATSMARAAMMHAQNYKGKVDVSGQISGIHSAAHAFGLVSTPSPAPGVADSPFMTWGEIEGTPFLLDGSDIAIAGDGAPSFKMPDVPYRDRLALGMTETIGKRYREKRKAAIEQAEAHHPKTPTFGSARSSDLLLNVSPAARKLATSKLGIRLGSDKALRASYTPSPLVKTPTPLRRTPVRTPGRTPIRTNTPASATSSITDNLLRLGNNDAPIPTTSSSSSLSNRGKRPAKTARPSATDFF